MFSVRQTSRELAGRTTGEFGHNVEMAQVASIFLEKMEQDALEGRRISAVPARTGLAYRLELVGADDLAGAKSLRAEQPDEVIARHILIDEPSAISVVAPRVLNLLTLEAPLQPSHLDEREVPNELEWRPAGR
jgi:hypothetical protein